MRYMLLLLMLVPAICRAEFGDVENIVKKREAEVSKAYRDLAQTVAESNRKAIEELKARLPNAGAEEKKAIALVVLSLNPTDAEAKSIAGGYEPPRATAPDLRSITSAFDTYVEEQKRLTKDQLDALMKHETNINTLEVRVKYVDERLKKLDELNQNETSMKSDLDELKKAYLQLRQKAAAEQNKN